MKLNDFLYQKRNETPLQDRKDYLTQLKKMRSLLELAKEDQILKAQKEVELKFNPLLQCLDDQISEREACIHLKKKYDIKLNELKPSSLEASLEKMDS